MGGAGREWAEQVQFVVEPQQCAQLWVSKSTLELRFHFGRCSRAGAGMFLIKHLCSIKGAGT